MKINNSIALDYFNDGVNNVKNDMLDIANNYVKLACHLKEIDSLGWYSAKYDNIYKFASTEFNISKSTVSRLLSIANKFCVDDVLEDKYKGYTFSKLSEMVTMNDDDLEYVRPDMTVKEIRQLKSYKEDTVSQEQEQVVGQISIDTFVATSQQLDGHKIIQSLDQNDNNKKCCMHSAGIVCNISGCTDVARSLDVICPGTCCWNCIEDCGARCNCSSHNNSRFASEINYPDESYVDKRNRILIDVYAKSCTLFANSELLPDPGKKKSFKYGSKYKMTIECIDN